MQSLYSYSTVDKKIPEVIFNFLPRVGVNATDGEIYNGSVSKAFFFFLIPDNTLVAPRICNF